MSSLDQLQPLIAPPAVGFWPPAPGWWLLLLVIPLLGWGNWLALPFAVAGVGLGALSRTNGGRNFCLIVLLIAVIRLSLGGGII